MTLEQIDRLIAAGPEVCAFFEAVLAEAMKAK